MSKDSVSGKTKLMKDKAEWALCQKTKKMTTDDTDEPLDESPNYKDTSTAGYNEEPYNCPTTANVPTTTDDNQQVSILPDSNLTTDGPECELQLPQSDSEPVSSSGSLMSTSASSIRTSESSSSVSASLNGDMQDFVILHTENDYDEAQEFKDNLYTDVGDGISITVDLFSEIDTGASCFKSIGTLHDRYRYILLFVTESLRNDKQCRFLNEILITLGLREGGSKAERVVPVFTKSGNCDVLELSILTGIPYHRRAGGDDLKRSYRKTVNNLVRSARDKFPL